LLGHCVDHRIGEPRERHPRRIDDLFLRVPFLREVFGQGFRRGRECTACRGFDRLAIEQDRETGALVRPDMHFLEEAIAQIRAAALTRRHHRIERLVFENLGENVPHHDTVIVRRNKTEPRSRHWPLLPFK